MGDKQLNAEVLHEENRHEWGGGTLTVYAEAGWEKAQHNSQERDVHVAKIQHKSLES